MHSCVSFDLEKQVLFWSRSLSHFLRSTDAGLVHAKSVGN
jgi:hypothetical protein